MRGSRLKVAARVWNCVIHGHPQQGFNDVQIDADGQLIDQRVWLWPWPVTTIFATARWPDSRPSSEPTPGYPPPIRARSPEQHGPPGARERLAGAASRARSSPTPRRSLRFMQGTVSLTHGDKVTIHTYTAPELGWRANTHIIELPTQLVLFDAQLTPAFAREVLGITTALNKPITRLYISHAHPDHFAGATEIDAPTYALAEVKQLIDRSGKLRVERGYQYTPDTPTPGRSHRRPIDHVVEAARK